MWGGTVDGVRYEVDHGLDVARFEEGSSVVLLTQEMTDQPGMRAATLNAAYLVQLGAAVDLGASGASVDAGDFVRDLVQALNQRPPTPAASGRGTSPTTLGG